MQARGAAPQDPAAERPGSFAYEHTRIAYIGRKPAQRPALMPSAIALEKPSAKAEVETTISAAA